MKRMTAILIAFFCSLQWGWCQELARRSFLGVRVTSEGSTVVVQSVETGSTAADAGIVPGDAMVRIGSIAISRPEQLESAARTYRAGTPVQFTVKRNGKQLQRGALGRPLPYETSESADVLYRSVSVEGSLYRTIITKPKTAGRHAAIFLIGGLGCYSLDGLRENGDAYGRILYGLTRAGYVTMRVEKSGEGDSEGLPCSDPRADLNLAVKRSVAGIETLKTYDFVDADRIVILAHSIGPIEGALVARQVSLKGFVAAETIGRSWFDYQVEIARSQPLLLGLPYEKVEMRARSNEICMSKFYIERLTPESILRSNPECSSYLPTQGGVPYTYFEQVAAVNLPEVWKGIDIPVLVIYGTSDPTTSADESQYLAGMVNSFNAGRATYFQIEGMGHHFDKQATQADALRALRNGKDGEFDSAVLTEIENWLGRIVSG